MSCVRIEYFLEFQMDNQSKKPLSPLSMSDLQKHPEREKIVAAIIDESKKENKNDNDGE